MNKCERCNIYIMDQTTVCPLCNTVLTEVTEKPEDNVLAQFFVQLGHGAKYPDVRRQNRMVHLLMRILLFCFLLTEAFLVYLNVHYTHGIKWSGITGIAMLYFYFSLSYWIRQDSGYAAKIGLQLLITLLLVVGIDFFIGSFGADLGVARNLQGGNRVRDRVILAEQNKVRTVALLVNACNNKVFNAVFLHSGSGAAPEAESYRLSRYNRHCARVADINNHKQYKYCDNKPQR